MARKPPILDKLLRALGAGQPRAGDRFSKSFDLGDGLVAEVEIKVRRSVSDHEAGERLQIALAELDRCPARAERCNEHKAKRGLFGSTSCSNRPVGALVHPKVPYVHFVCANHARRHKEAGAIVVRIGKGRLTEARRRARAEEEAMYREEAGAEAIGRALYAIAQPPPVRDELAEKRAKRRRR